MNLGQFCICKETTFVWQINQIKPLLIKEACGPNTENKQVSEEILKNDFHLVPEDSTHHKSIIRLLDKLPLDQLDFVRLSWNDEAKSFSFQEQTTVNVETPIKASDLIINTLTADEATKRKKKLIDSLKSMNFNQNLMELKEEMKKSLKKNVHSMDEFKEDEIQEKESVKTKVNDYLVIEPNNKYELNKLILAPETELQMDKVILKLELGDFINSEWGLSEITESSAKQPLNFQGPPGTGKTLAAKSIGAKLNKQILQVDYGQLFSKWVGETGKNIQKYFAKAKNEDMILFFDEADALVTPRHKDMSNPGSSTNQNIFMQELDKFDGIVILTTNHFQHYDEALFRRFQHVEFKLPTPEQREELFKIHVPSKIKLKKEFNWIKLVECSNDFSGGDIKNVVEQTLSSKATILRNQNLAMPIDEFKAILRKVTFDEQDFIKEINNISSNRKAFKTGSSQTKGKLGLVS